MKIIFFLLLLTSSFVHAEEKDPCAKEVKQFCERGVLNEGRWTCLGKKLDSVSPECLENIQKESSQKHHACYLSQIFFCKGEFGDPIGKHYFCLTTHIKKIGKECDTMLVGMRKKGHEFRTKIRSMCAADFAKHCPDMSEAKQGDCLTKVYKAGGVSKDCKKILDTATKTKK